MDNVSAKFLFVRIKISCTTYRWTDETTPGNFKLVLRGKEIDCLNPIQDTLDIDISTWTIIEPEFVVHFNFKTNTVASVWDFRKLKHEDKETPADLMLEVAKLTTMLDQLQCHLQSQFKQHTEMQKLQYL